MANSKELRSFKKHFQENTGIKVSNVLEEQYCYHWKRLGFDELNCEDMEKIIWYCKTFFYEEDKYYHKSLRLMPYENGMFLTVDVSLIEKFI